MANKYRSFSDLSASETEGVDYQIVVNARPSAVAIVAPHGGEIEPGTSQIGEAVAGDDFSEYRFEGLYLAVRMAISISNRSFEPAGCKLVAASEVAVGIHGRRDWEDPNTVFVGGKYEGLRDSIVAALQEAGFQAIAVSESDIAGTDQRNICNRGRGGRGALLEIPRTLRDDLVVDSDRLGAFDLALREAIKNIVGE